MKKIVKKISIVFLLPIFVISVYSFVSNADVSIDDEYVFNKLDSSAFSNKINDITSGFFTNKPENESSFKNKIISALSNDYKDEYTFKIALKDSLRLDDFQFRNKSDTNEFFGKQNAQQNFIIDIDSEIFNQLRTLIFKNNVKDQNTYVENVGDGNGSVTSSDEDLTKLTSKIGNLQTLIIGMLVGLFLLFLMLYLLLRNLKNDIFKKIKQRSSSQNTTPSQQIHATRKDDNILSELKELRQENKEISNFLEKINEKLIKVKEQEDVTASKTYLEQEKEIQEKPKPIRLYYKNAGSEKITEEVSMDNKMALWIIEPNETSTFGYYYPASSAKNILLGSVDTLLMKNCFVVNNRYDIEAPRDFKIIEKGKVERDGNYWKIIKEVKIELS